MGVGLVVAPSHSRLSALQLARRRKPSKSGEFDDTDENKLVYTELFESYTERIEAFLADALAARLGPGFAMERLLEVVRRRGEDELAGDVWDLLLSLSDFNECKALMLAHKTEREGRGGALDGLLCGRGLESATR